MAALLVFDDAMIEHDPGIGHPERPDRLRIIRDRLRDAPISDVAWTSPQPASRDTIARVHDDDYVDWINTLRGRSEAVDVDTIVSPGSVDAAYLAAGAAVEAVRSVIDEPGRRSFALVRPPGHHAETGRAMGFCLFNNIAIAAAEAIATLDCHRVLIVDWDVHHGNGTQHMFYDRNDVLYFSTHRYPFYPGTGAAGEIGVGDGAGFTVNVPLSPGYGDAQHIAIFEDLLIPIADEFAPDLVLVSAGFDSHRDDPLGGMMMTDPGFASLCAILCDLADRHAGGRLALVLEGGYDLEALAKSVHACAGVLAGGVRSPIEPTSPAIDDILRPLRQAHAGYWPI